MDGHFGVGVTVKMDGWEGEKVLTMMVNLMTRAWLIGFGVTAKEDVVDGEIAVECNGQLQNEKGELDLTQTAKSQMQSANKL